MDFGDDLPLKALWKKASIHPGVLRCGCLVEGGCQCCGCISGCALCVPSAATGPEVPARPPPGAKDGPEVKARSPPGAKDGPEVKASTARALATSSSSSESESESEPKSESIHVADQGKRVQPRSRSRSRDPPHRQFGTGMFAFTTLDLKQLMSVKPHLFKPSCDEPGMPNGPDISLCDHFGDVHLALREWVMINTWHFADWSYHCQCQSRMRVLNAECAYNQDPNLENAAVQIKAVELKGVKSRAIDLSTWATLKLAHEAREHDDPPALEDGDPCERTEPLPSEHTEKQAEMPYAHCRDDALFGEP